MASQTKTWFLMALLVAVALAGGYILGREYVLPAFGISLAMVLGSYFFSDKMVLAISGAKISNDEALQKVVSEVASGAGLPTPKVYEISDTSPNAFATGRDQKHSSIAITTGLREKLNKPEIQGVIGHELSHIKNYDILLMSVVAILVGAISLLADWFMRSLWYQDEENRNEALLVGIGLLLAIVSPIIATIIQLAISRRREFDADAGSAKITADPDALADALEKISADRTPAKFANNATAHLFISNPFKDKETKSFLSGLFDTHPPIQERVKLLRAM